MLSVLFPIIIRLLADGGNVNHFLAKDRHWILQDRRHWGKQML